MSTRRAPLTSVLVFAAMVLPAVAACGSSASPTPTPTTAPAPVATPAPAGPSMSPGVTMDGTTVTVVGVGRYQSAPFALPAGSATVRISACSSTQVMPFITLADSTGQSVGLIVDPEKVINNLKGGQYTVSAQTNADCRWMVTITPA